MKVIVDGVPIGDVPIRCARQPGELFSQLVGVRVSSNGNWMDVEPLYIPLIRWQCRAGQIFIEINNHSRPLLYITLQARKPFVNIYRFSWNEHEGE